MLEPHIIRAVRRRLIVAAVSAIPLLILLEIAEAERGANLPRLEKGADNARP